MPHPVLSTPESPCFSVFSTDQMCTSTFSPTHGGENLLLKHSPSTGKSEHRPTEYTTKSVNLEDSNAYKSGNETSMLL